MTVHQPSGWLEQRPPLRGENGESWHPSPGKHESFPLERCVPTEIRNSSGPFTELGDDTRERPNPLEGRHLTCQMQSDAARRQPARFDPIGGKGGATRFLHPPAGSGLSITSARDLLEKIQPGDHLAAL